jgi:hypothetical protein
MAVKYGANGGWGLTATICPSFCEIAWNSSARSLRRSTASGSVVQKPAKSSRMDRATSALFGQDENSKQQFEQTTLRQHLQFGF